MSKRQIRIKSNTTGLCYLRLLKRRYRALFYEKLGCWPTNKKFFDLVEEVEAVLDDNVMITYNSTNVVVIGGRYHVEVNKNPPKYKNYDGDCYAIMNNTISRAIGGDEIPNWRISGLSAEETAEILDACERGLLVIANAAQQSVENVEQLIRAATRRAIQIFNNTTAPGGITRVLASGTLDVLEQFTLETIQEYISDKHYRLNNSIQTKSHEYSDGDDINNLMNKAKTFRNAFKSHRSGTYGFQLIRDRNAFSADMDELLKLKITHLTVADRIFMNDEVKFEEYLKTAVIHLPQLNLIDSVFDKYTEVNNSITRTYFKIDLDVDRYYKMKYTDFMSCTPKTYIRKRNGKTYVFIHMYENLTLYVKIVLLKARQTGVLSVNTLYNVKAENVTLISPDVVNNHHETITINHRLYDKLFIYALTLESPNIADITKKLRLYYNTFKISSKGGNEKIDLIQTDTMRPIDFMHVVNHILNHVIKSRYRVGSNAKAQKADYDKYYGLNTFSTTLVETIKSFFENDLWWKIFVSNDYEQRMINTADFHPYVHEKFVYIVDTHKPDVTFLDDDMMDVDDEDIVEEIMGMNDQVYFKYAHGDVEYAYNDVTKKTGPIKFKSVPAALLNKVYERLNPVYTLDEVSKVATVDERFEDIEKECALLASFYTIGIKINKMYLGVAGCGKSVECYNYIQQNNNNKTKTILYVTSKRNEARKVEKLYHEKGILNFKACTFHSGYVKSKKLSKNISILIIDEAFDIHPMIVNGILSNCENSIKILAGDPAQCGYITEGATPIFGYWQHCDDIIYSNVSKRFGPKVARITEHLVPGLEIYGCGETDVQIAQDFEVALRITFAHNDSDDVKSAHLLQGATIDEVLIDFADWKDNLDKKQHIYVALTRVSKKLLLKGVHYIDGLEPILENKSYKINRDTKLDQPLDVELFIKESALDDCHHREVFTNVETKYVPIGDTTTITFNPDVEKKLEDTEMMTDHVHHATVSNAEKLYSISERYGMKRGCDVPCPTKTVSDFFTWMFPYGVNVTQDLHEDMSKEMLAYCQEKEDNISKDTTDLLDYEDDFGTLSFKKQCHVGKENAEINKSQPVTEIGRSQGIYCSGANRLFTRILETNTKKQSPAVPYMGLPLRKLRRLIEKKLGSYNKKINQKYKFMNLDLSGQDGSTRRFVLTAEHTFMKMIIEFMNVDYLFTNYNIRFQDRDGFISFLMRGMRRSGSNNTFSGNTFMTLFGLYLLHKDFDIDIQFSMAAGDDAIVYISEDDIEKLLENDGEAFKQMKLRYGYEYKPTFSEIGEFVNRFWSYDEILNEITIIPNGAKYSKKIINMFSETASFEKLKERLDGLMTTLSEYTNEEMETISEQHRVVIAWAMDPTKLLSTKITEFYKFGGSVESDLLQYISRQSLGTRVGDFLNYTCNYQIKQCFNSILKKKKKE